MDIEGIKTKKLIQVEIFVKIMAIKDTIHLNLATLLLKLFIYFHRVKREQVSFSMAIENMELIRECCYQHSRMGTAKFK